jgi:hypothetical protein
MMDIIEIFSIFNFLFNSINSLQASNVAVYVD